MEKEKWKNHIEQELKKYLTGDSPASYKSRLNTIKNKLDSSEHSALVSLDVFDYQSYDENFVKYKETVLSLIDSNQKAALNLYETILKGESSKVMTAISRGNEVSAKIGQNLIIYGAPGTGKSYWVEKKYGEKNLTRVVFHPEYTYFDFVGQYRPCPVYDSNHQRNFVTVSGEDAKVGGEPFINYRFVPGPFTDVLVKAWNDKDNMYTLLIEELNRADAPAVFGDVFQLLDRKENGESEYGIKPSAEWAAYLKTEIKNEEARNTLIEDGEFKVKIPSNMNIIATMNSADQGVHVLDTAFKRRWDYEFMSIDTKDIDEDLIVRYGGKDIKWKELLGDINKKLSSEPYNISEDRRIGPFFVKPDSMNKADKCTDSMNKADAKGKIDAMKKILFYLWDDVLRNHGRKEFFGNVATLNDLYETFLEKDIMNLYEGRNSSNV